MFGRRNKPDGFEWHKYIRTTVRLRREQRRERVLEARRAAGQQANAAGTALVQGSRAAGAAAWGGARAGLGAVGLAAQAVWAVIATVSVLAGQRLAILLRPLIAALARPNIGGPIALAGAIALGSGIGRYRGTGLDGEALITPGIGMPRLPGFAALGISPRTAGIAAAIAVIAGGAAWFASGTKTNLAGLTGQLPLIGGAKPLQGRAEALGGDLVRVAGTTVRLAGIEAPERQQVCGAGGRRYQCGAAAQAALGRLVNGRALSCTLSGTDPAGRPLASCTRGTTDINGELVRQGHVFALSGLFASYAG